MAFKASSLTQPTSIIRIVIITLSIIIFPLLGVAYPMTGEEYDYHFYADGMTPAIIGIGFMCPSWSFIWEVIATSLRAFNILYHPGVEIALEFLPFGANAAIAGMVIYWQTYIRETDMYCGKGGYGYDRYDCQLEKRFDGLMYSSGAFMLVVAGLHLTLFVIACKDTHKQRLAARAKRYSNMEA